MSLAGLFLRRTSKQGWFRNIVIVFAIMLATAILLSALAMAHGLKARFTRSDNWDNLFGTTQNYNLSLKFDDQAEKKVLLVQWDQRFDKEVVTEAGVRKMSEEAELPQGILREPKEGEILVSPELKRRIESEPELAARYATYTLSTDFPEELLVAPDELKLLYRIPDERVERLRAGDIGLGMARLVEAEKIQGKKTGTSGVDIMMAVCGIGVCFPLFVLMMSAIRIGIKQREQRYAALSLMGASRQQINRIILAETVAAAGVGLLLGVVLYVGARIWLLKDIKFGNSALFLSEISLEPAAFTMTLIGVLMVTILANWWALRRVKTSSLGVMREAKLARRPYVWSLLPLAVGMVLAFWTSSRGSEWYRDMDSGLIILLFGGNFLLLMIGLLSAGAYLTYLLALAMDRLARRAPAAVAAKRMKSFARPIFASVSGVVLALFVGSFFMAAVASLAELERSTMEDTESFIDLASKEERADVVRYSLGGEEEAETLMAAVAQRPELEAKIKGVYRLDYLIDDWGKLGGHVYTCESLAELTQMKCEAELAQEKEVLVAYDYEEMNYRLVALKGLAGERQPSQIAWKLERAADAVALEKHLQSLGFETLVETGSVGSVEQRLSEYNDIPSTLRGLIEAVMAGTVVTILVGALSLAVAMIGGFFERKRSFFDLRLMGVNIHTLNLVVVLESLPPMLLASVVAIAVGLFAAKSFLTSVTAMKDFKFVLPDAGYFVAVGLSLLVAFGVILAILPILKRITSLEENRGE